MKTWCATHRVEVEEGDCCKECLLSAHAPGQLDPLTSTLLDRLRQRMLEKLQSIMDTGEASACFLSAYTEQYLHIFRESTAKKGKEQAHENDEH